MLRIVDNYLNDWKNSGERQSLIIRGARQIGKTTAVRKLGQSFEHFVEIDFEKMQQAHAAFSTDLDPKRIISDLNFLTHKSITPGKTLLFLDEIQACPRALTSLRYFYELMPELHVIAAGSLLDFAIEQVGIPVGRVQFLHMYPMTFQEFLLAQDETFLIDHIMQHDLMQPYSNIAHEKALRLFGEYIAIGGMPKAVASWCEKRDYTACMTMHHDLITAYKQDFEKYAKKSQIKYLDVVFSKAPFQLGKQFQYKQISEAYRKRELEPALLLLEKANIITKTMQTSAQSLPLAAQTNPECFKINMIDVALAQTILGLTSEQWIFDINAAFINKGMIAENFVGQELLAYSNPCQENHLYFWRRNKHGSEAEIDYVIAQSGKIIPIEVKSGKGSTLKSTHLFLNEHPQTPYGIRFSTQNYSLHEKIKSYPLYAVMRAAADWSRFHLIDK